MVVPTATVRLSGVSLTMEPFNSSIGAAARLPGFLSDVPGSRHADGWPKVRHLPARKPPKAAPANGRSLVFSVSVKAAAEMPLGRLGAISNGRRGLPREHRHLKAVGATSARRELQP